MTRLLSFGHGTATAEELVALLADAAVLVGRAEVMHLDHRGRLEPHRPTEGVRRDGELLAYDLGATPPLPGS